MAFSSSGPADPDGSIPSYAWDFRDRGTTIGSAVSHTYQPVVKVLPSRGEKLDEFVERECAEFYADSNGRPSLAPGMYFRLLLLGYFEGIDSERGIAWRAADSLRLPRFLGIGLD